jgi:peptide/nickel transport system substrate-binding protein
MIYGRQRRRLTRWANVRLGLAAVAALVGLAAAACSAGTPGSSGAPANGGTVTYGFASGSQPNWIFPYDTPAYSSVANLDDLQQLLYRPLYWFGGQNDQPTADYRAWCSTRWPRCCPSTGT